MIKIATTKGVFRFDVNPPHSVTNYNVVCPVCVDEHKDQKKKRGSINMSKGLYNCHYCGIGGKITNGERQIEGTSLKVLDKPFKFSKEISPTMRQWLINERKVSPETAVSINIFSTVKSMKLASIPEGFPDREKLLNTFVDVEVLAACNIYQGVLMNIQYRDQWKNWTMETGGESIFFNADIISKNTIILITEGWMDTAASCEAGLTNSISVPTGANITPDERKIFNRTGSIEILSEPTLHYLDNCWSDFKNVKEVVLAFDNDAPGQKLKEMFRRRFTNAGKKISFVNFKKFNSKNGIDDSDNDKYCKDNNDVLKHYGKEAVVSLYEQREEIKSSFLISVNDVREEMMRHFKEGIPPALKAGWINMDPHFGFYPGNIIGANGYPASGKTTFNMNLMVALSAKYGYKWMVYSPENEPVSLFLASIAGIYAGKSTDKLTKSNRFKDEKEYAKALEWVQEHFELFSKRNVPNLNELRDTACSSSSNFRGIFIDPWNRMVRHKDDRGKNIADYIQDQLTEQIAFGKDTGITTLISVHPPTQDKKNRKAKEDGTYDHPGPYEVEGGKVWFSSLHVLYCVHRPNPFNMVDKTTELYVQKLKDRKLYGMPTGDKTPLNFELNMASRRFYLDGQCPLDKTSAHQMSLNLEKEKNHERIGDIDQDDLPF